MYNWTLSKIIFIFYQCICRIIVEVTFVILNIRILFVFFVVINQRESGENQFVLIILTKMSNIHTSFTIRKREVLQVEGGVDVLHIHSGDGLTGGRRLVSGLHLSHAGPGDQRPHDVHNGSEALQRCRVHKGSCSDTGWIFVINKVTPERTRPRTPARTRRPWRPAVSVPWRRRLEGEGCCGR